MAERRGKPRKGYSWTKPRRLVSVRARQDEIEMLQRLSVELGISQNQVILEALRRYHQTVFVEAA